MKFEILNVQRKKLRERERGREKRRRKEGGGRERGGEGKRTHGTRVDLRSLANLKVRYSRY